MSGLFRSPLALLITIGAFFFCLGLLGFVGYALYQEKTITQYRELPPPVTLEVDRFPVSVDPVRKLIVEDPLVDWYVTQHLSIDTSKIRQHRFVDRLFAKLAKWNALQQLASPLTRILVIYPGERREEVVKNFGDILHWKTEQRETFSALVTESLPTLTDGKFFPGRYTVAKTATPEQVADLLIEKFSTEVLARYDDVVTSQVPLEDALTIASLLEREAYDFTDMRIISGIIWNRLFINMPLQLDASLQYAKGSLSSEAKWWPKINPADKYIESPFNTYQETGLPPTPIANPSLESVVAALNPRSTDCLFYFHDDDGTFYCTPTYEEHVTILKKIYGQGR